MPVKMRLRREGKKKQPFFRVVVADVRSPRDGRFIEDIGYYQPLRQPSVVSIDRDRALYWLRNGVQPSQAVVNLLRIEGIWQEFKPGSPDPRAARREAGKGLARAQAAAAPAESTPVAPPAPQAQAEPEAAQRAAPAESTPVAPDEAGQGGATGAEQPAPESGAGQADEGSSGAAQAAEASPQAAGEEERPE